MSKKVDRIEVVDIQFVTGYNTDPVDLGAGGSPVLGHFAIVAKDEADGFIKEIKKHIRTLGKSDKVLDVIVKDVGTRNTSEIRRGKDKINWFKSYLNKEQ
ncbi:MAG: hypothetical protein Q8R55_04520, partial [Candidatus Taylorbacteria bacterium]|nr:hypothetical protein [Candidatus Taylorbacteria bacterium]